MGLIGVAKCNATMVVVLLVLSMSINGAVVVTNLSNPTDLAPNFAGTIFGIISFIGGTSGFIVPSITGEFLSMMGVRKHIENLHNFYSIHTVNI